MNRSSAKLIVAAVCLVLFGASLSRQAGAKSPAKDVTITKDDQIANIDCNDGDSVTVRSDDNKITIKGDCRKLTVSGDDNIVNASAAKEIQVAGNDNKIAVDTVGKVALKGDDNIVTWKAGAGGKGPEISSKGKDNKILQSSR